MHAYSSNLANLLVCHTHPSLCSDSSWIVPHQCSDVRGHLLHCPVLSLSLPLLKSSYKRNLTQKREDTLAYFTCHMSKFLSCYGLYFKIPVLFIYLSGDRHANSFQFEAAVHNSHCKHSCMCLIGMRVLISLRYEIPGSYMNSQKI